MANWVDVGQWVLGTGGLLTAGIATYSARSNRRKTDTESGVNVATKSKTEAEAASLNEETEQRREKFWNDKLNETEKKFQEKIDELHEDIAWLKVLIENHVPWDWETQRLLIQHGIDHRKPPTLNYIRSKSPKDEVDEI